LDDIKFGQGQVLSALQAQQTPEKLEDTEFKVFSQWGEDGIIQFLTRFVPIKNKTFVEFGVEDFAESNCRFLLVKDDWRGFVLDGSEAHIRRLRQTPHYARHQLDAITAFVTRENINDLLRKSGFEEELGILSIDIDGNDYHVLQAIDSFKASILICEYNAVFGGDRAITVPYDPAFQRTRKHHSNLYFGASLAAITHLAAEKGYTLVGTNSNRVNAFFVRNDLMNDVLRGMRARHVYQPSRVRESRDQLGKLTFLSNEERLRLIRGMPVVNVLTGLEESL